MCVCVCSFYLPFSSFCDCYSTAIASWVIRLYPLTWKLWQNKNTQSSTKRTRLTQSTVVERLWNREVQRAFSCMQHCLRASRLRSEQIRVGFFEIFLASSLLSANICRPIFPIPRTKVAHVTIVDFVQLSLQHKIKFALNQVFAHCYSKLKNNGSWLRCEKHTIENA